MEVSNLERCEKVPVESVFFYLSLHTSWSQFRDVRLGALWLAVRGREGGGGYCPPASRRCHALQSQPQHKNAAGTKAITPFYSNTSEALCSYRRAHMHAFAVTTITQKLYGRELCQRSTLACQTLIHQPGSHTRQPPAGHLHHRLRMASQSWDNGRASTREWERRSVPECVFAVACCVYASKPVPTNTSFGVIQRSPRNREGHFQVLCTWKNSSVCGAFLNSRFNAFSE